MQLDPALPMQRGAVGLEFFGVGVDSLEVLENLERTTERLRVPPRGGLVTSISRTTGLDCDDRARMFFESGGVREDPTTGSANSIACRCLHAVSSLPLPMDPITPG
jgi:predicted PhzF superfamily epimerase YddE/YHI9